MSIQYKIFMMINQRENRGFKRFLRFRYLFAINLVILLFLFVYLGRELVRSLQIQKDIAVLQAKADTLIAGNLEIAKLNTVLQTESFLEREARLKLGLKKPGEQVVVVETDPQKQSDEILPGPLETLIGGAQPLQKVSNPAKWWYYFFNHSRFQQLTYAL